MLIEAPGVGAIEISGSAASGSGVVADRYPKYTLFSSPWDAVQLASQAWMKR